MAFTPRWEPAAANYLADLKAKAKASLDKRKANSTAKAAPAEGLYKQVNKTINLLLDNPRHPGLCTHEYSDLPHPWDAKQKVWEAHREHIYQRLVIRGYSHQAVALIYGAVSLIITGILIAFINN